MFKASLTYKPKLASLLQTVILKLWTFGIPYNSAALSNSKKKDIHILHTLHSRFLFIFLSPCVPQARFLSEWKLQEFAHCLICKLCKAHVLQLLIAFERHLDFQATLSTTDISNSLLPALLRFLFQGEGSDSRNYETCAYLPRLGVTFKWVADFFNDFFFFLSWPWFWYSTVNGRNLSVGPFQHL